jgi:hypothetical protein
VYVCIERQLARPALPLFRKRVETVNRLFAGQLYLDGTSLNS